MGFLEYKTWKESLGLAKEGLYFQFLGVLHAQMLKFFAHAVYNLLIVQLWQVKEDGPNLPCDTCNGKGWMVCDFCKGQKTNVQVS